MVTGSAERAISEAHRTTVDRLAVLTNEVQPCYRSSSGFRFTYDRSVRRHVADSSALAQQLGLLTAAMAEPQFLLRSGPEPGTAQPGAVDRGDGVGRGIATETRLTVPATVAAREKAQQACRALGQGWCTEAEELFLAGTELTPTDPFVWFGAGLAASKLGHPRAGDHIARAARYLLADDRAGAAYAFILAAGLHEQAGNRPQARSVLRDGLAQLNKACPAISLHLARLGPDRSSRLQEVLDVDPMMEADILAIGLYPGPDLIAERYGRIEADIGRVEDSIAALRGVDGGPSWTDPPRPVEAPAKPSRLPLCEHEIALATRLRDCEAEIVTARRVVEERVVARRSREQTWSANAELARSDLVNRITIPVFAKCAALAVALLLVAGVARPARAALPGAGIVVDSAIWLLVLGLVYAAGRLAVTTWWPRRAYQAAREAKLTMPQLRFEAAQLREQEFHARRRFNQASQDAELKIQEIRNRRDFLAPRRPRFIGRPVTD